MNLKYAMANIKMPILIKEDKTIEPMVDYIKMSFDICNELPEKNTNKHTYQSLLESILSSAIQEGGEKEEKEGKKREEEGEQKEEEEGEQKEEGGQEKKEEGGQEKKEEGGQEKKEEEKVPILIHPNDILPKRTICADNITLKKRTKTHKKTIKHIKIDTDGVDQEE